MESAWSPLHLLEVNPNMLARNVERMSLGIWNFIYIFKIPSVARAVLHLDGVGHIDNRPSTDKHHRFVKKTKKYLTSDMWHQTHDTWHMTPDTWYLTCDTWHVTHGGRWTFSQNFSSLSLMVWDTQCLEDSKGSPNESVNDKGVCRTAPATAGLLNTSVNQNFSIVCLSDYSVHFF